MLTDDQIEALGSKAQKLLDPIQEYLIREIAARIAEAGSMTATAQYQVWRLQNLGISQRQLKKELRRLLKISHRDLRKLLEDAGEEGYTYDIRQLPQVQAVPFRQSRVMQDIVSAAVDLAREDLSSITQSLGFCPDAEGKVCLPLTEAYEQACDTAFMRVSTGAQDFQSAVREAAQGLAKHGIQYIDYESGVHTSIEAATRRSVLGGMGLMQEKISQGVHDDCGCDGWEISAHACSAPDHEPIQGKQYSDEAYQKLNDSLRRRIGTLNCGHAAHPIILGISRPQYTQQELEKLRQDNEDGVEIDGKHYTMYEATQKQRAIERAMRAQKKKILVAEATGDPKLPQLQSRMQVLSQEYSRFSDQAGLRTQVERTQVADKLVANPSNSDILRMKTGARIIAPYSKPAMEHASRYYGLVRKMSTDVGKIAKNTGFPIEEISRIKSFIFLEKHDLGDGKYEFFAPDFAMAESWQRLIEGKPEKHDLTLLQHEIMENRLMHEGLSQEQAHLEASKKYNYSKESDQFYALLEKHSKK